MRRAALYLRVSTTGQTTENQQLELQQVARRMGVDIIEVYCDHGIIGSKGRDKRPAFDRLCKDAAKRRFDLIMAWSVDRLGRVAAGPDRLPRRNPRAQGGPLFAPAGLGHHHSGWKSAVSNAGRVRGVRAGHDQGASEGGSCEGAGERESPWTADGSVKKPKMPFVMRSRQTAFGRSPRWLELELGRCKGSNRILFVEPG